MSTRFANSDGVIDRVKSLVEGDAVRDFYTADPSYGRVVNVTDQVAVIQWEGLDEPKSHARKGSKNLIRRKRAGEV